MTTIDVFACGADVVAQLPTFFGRHADIRGLALAELLPSLNALRPRAPGILATQPEATGVAPVAGIGASRRHRHEGGESGNEKGTETNVHARYRRRF